MKREMHEMDGIKADVKVAYNGHDNDYKHAKPSEHGLVKGVVYTVLNVAVYDETTGVELVEVNGVEFNSTNFDLVVNQDDVPGSDSE